MVDRALVFSDDVLRSVGLGHSLMAAGHQQMESPGEASVYLIQRVAEKIIKYEVIYTNRIPRRCGVMLFDNFPDEVS